MKIAFLTPEYPHYKVRYAAGLGTSTQNLSRALVRLGHQVYVFVYGQEADETFEDNGIHFYLIGNRNYRFAKWLSYRKHIQKQVQHVIDKEQIDILEAPDWTGITAFMKFSVPLVIRFHGSDTYFCHLEGRKQKRKNFWFEKLAVQGADVFVAPTTFSGKLSKKLFNLSGKEVKTIHYGLELDKFTNRNPEEFKEGLILYIGTIIRKKGVLELPAIFKKVREHCPHAKLVLVGSDSPDTKTGVSSTWQLLQEGLDEASKDAVEYLGKVPYTQVQELIKQAQVCVFPTYAETLGMVTIESMALQKPVVNSNIGWAQELMEDSKSGFLVHPVNHDTYAEKIITLLQDKSLCLQIGTEARNYVEQHFDIEQQVEKNLTFYEDVIKEAKSKKVKR